MSCAPLELTGPSLRLRGLQLGDAPRILALLRDPEVSLYFLWEPPRDLAEWSLAPDAEGVFDRHVSVVVGHGFSDVCIVASISTREPKCPANVEDGTVWTQLAVPPLQ